ncbi:MAG TPA: PqqD family peptide modification chaperone [Bryobacteraceae bacterium]|jgi:hypothetical protein|nr:PqqD family peptide modification chaperone [Bryobacteraceae bacterium]
MISGDISQDRAVPPETWEFPVENGLIVARPDVPCLFSMNQTASLIWRAYCETASPNSAADTLVETFGISRELATKDVDATVNNWANAGLLGRVESIALPQWDGQHGEPCDAMYCSIEGTAFLLLTDCPAVSAELAPRLAGIRVAACKPGVTIAVWGMADDRFVIVADEECIAIEKGVRPARAVLFQELIRRARSGRDWLALLHAGACGIGGRCVLFPASSYSGKSTLAAALMASGFALYSDDFTGIEADSLQIPAMPFAIAARRGSWDVLRPWIPDIDDSPALESYGEQVKFLPVPHADGLAAGDAVAIVFTQWAAHVEVSERTLSTADVIARLSGSGFWVRHDRASIGAFIAWLDRLPKSTLEYGELTDAIARVSALAKS